MQSCAAALSELTQKFGGYTYTVETRAGKSTYSVTDGADTITVPIRWAFGAKRQTWVLERNGKLYESLVSLYPEVKAQLTGRSAHYTKNATGGVRGAN